MRSQRDDRFERAHARPKRLHRVAETTIAPTNVPLAVDVRIVVSAEASATPHLSSRVKGDSRLGLPDKGGSVGCWPTTCAPSGREDAPLAAEDTETVAVAPLWRGGEAHEATSLPRGEGRTDTARGGAKFNGDGRQIFLFLFSLFSSSRGEGSPPSPPASASGLAAERQGQILDGNHVFTYSIVE
eukprot:scaffold107702_cov34-Tisochrysis_lutea.AAC.2